MKKILPILLAFFAACSSNTEPIDNGNDTIDEAIIGKWKVEYSKTIKPAVYILTEEQLEEAQKGNPDFDFKLGLNYAEDAKITEYLGNWGEPNVIPESGMFHTNEFRIEIKNNNRLVIAIGGGNNTEISYKIENGHLVRLPASSGSLVTIYYLYRLEDDELIIELVKAEGAALTYYTISKYSKIEE